MLTVSYKILALMTVSRMFTPSQAAGTLFNLVNNLIDLLQGNGIFNKQS
jgi:hypothetical protein